MRRLASTPIWPGGLVRRLDSLARRLGVLTALTALLMALGIIPSQAIIDANDFGDAPLPYPTRANDSGASHRAVQGLHLGPRVDAEPDGVPSAYANSDDATPAGVPDDEDGVFFVTNPLPPGNLATVHVIASENGFLDAWVDFNRNGDWSDRDDRIFQAERLVPGTNVLKFAVPQEVSAGLSFSRWRYSQKGDLDFTRFGNEGEVEDHPVDIGGPMDFGDAPQVYPTLRADNGARHVVREDFFLGQFIDAESDGQPAPLANGDDSNPMGAADDEDGVQFESLPLVAGTTARIRVMASKDGLLDAWVDFNADGDWNDEGEQVFNSGQLISGVNNLSFNVLSTAVTSGSVYARFRFSTDGKLPPFGPAPDGEVEDYRTPISQPLDFGDAPDSYQTLLSSDGPRHIPLKGFFLGSELDTESDGQPDSDAKGDDSNPSSGPNDEDGVSFASALSPGQTASVVVTASGIGKLDAWVDFGIDGSFSDRIDQIFNSLTLAAGANTLTFNVPSSAKIGASFARFRLSREGKLPYFGSTQDGEVEDYRVAIREPLDYGDAPDTYRTTLSRNGARHARNPDVFLGLRIDVEGDGQPNADATGDDINPLDFPSDEDGVSDGNDAHPGETVSFLLRASTSGFLNAWVDFGADGSFAEPEDQIFKDYPLTGGTNSLSFDVPENAKLGRTFARLRYSLQGGLSYEGLAPNGEVEDYSIDITEPPIPCERTNHGRDFWVTFPGNYAPDPDNPLRLSLCIVGPRLTTGQVEIPGLGWITNFSLGADRKATIQLPKEAELGDANDEILNNGIHVRASAEVAVFGMSRVFYTTDGFMAIPADVIGKDYIIQAYNNEHSGVPSLNGSQFGFVAMKDATAVTIIPAVEAAGHPMGIPYTVILNRGQTYQLRCTNDAPRDLSGTFVSADKPIGVFGSHKCANINSPSKWFCDYIVEQILPEERAGSSFVTMPLATRTKGDTFRFYSVQKGSQVFVNGAHVATIDRGKFHEEVINAPAYIAVEGRILVNQLANSSDFDLVTDSDPFNIVIPSIDMWRTEYEICAPDSGFASHFVNLVVSSTHIDDITLDGAAISPAVFVPVGSSGFHGARISVTPGRHFLRGFDFATTQPGGPVAFGCIVYGWDEYDSYGFPGGMFFPDRTPPTVTCLTNLIFFPAGINDAGPCHAYVPDLLNPQLQFVTYSDNCPLDDAFVFQTPPPGPPSRLPAGTNQITITVIDTAGNAGSCSVTFIVVDISAPLISCPQTIVANCASDEGAVVNFAVPAFTTGCGAPLPVQCQPPSGSLFPPGTTLVTCVATNFGNQIASCEFPVIVRCLSINPSSPIGPSISWTGGGVLQTATRLDDPKAWIDLQSAPNPYPIPPTNGTLFFRIRYGSGQTP